MDGWSGWSYIISQCDTTIGFLCFRTAPYLLTYLLLGLYICNTKDVGSILLQQQTTFHGQQNVFSSTIEEPRWLLAPCLNGYRYLAEKCYRCLES
jgi:hypothetical protein